MWNPSICNCEYNKIWKKDKYLDIKHCSCEERLFPKLAVAYVNDILNTTETSLKDRKVICEKNSCLIHKVSFIIICLLLLIVISISCYYYYARDWIKRLRFIVFYIKWRI